MKGIKKWKGTLRIAVAMLLILPPLTIACCHLWIAAEARGLTYNDIAQIPKIEVGLVLGTSKSTTRGRENLYFTYRVQAAYALFKAKKIDYILVSGDNREQNYNEPLYMKSALIRLGVPADRIISDQRGLRTLDSVIRARAVFGQDSLIIISQPFQNERAIFIANHKGIYAIGYNAKSIYGKASYRMKLREYLARTKAVLDIYVLDTKPEYLERPVKI
ncbi:MAG: ElyC/SanA/YdcF family protein [Flavobacteriales bacterium]